MKPTKEQLEDPKFWDEYAKPDDKYCSIGVISGRCFFSRNLDGVAGGCQIIAKRPKAAWAPEVGEECEFNHPIFGWTGCTIIGPFRTGVVCAPNGGGFYRGSHSDYRPLKTQRQELIDILVSTHSLSEGMQADAILATFELAEKD